MYKKVNVNSWARRSTHEFFRDYADPFFNFSASLDVGRACRYAKENGLATSLTLLYYSLLAANEIREFRIRLLEEELVEFDRIHATQTILNDDETFSFAYFEMKDDLLEFDRSGKEAKEKYRSLRSFDVESDRLDLIYYSVIPWVSFTSFKHASRLDPRQTVPRIVFGKIYEEAGSKKMPLSVEANHAIMDGFHVGKFFNSFQELLDAV
ncbi:MAG: hypothetical protein JO053_13470 [Acidobacteria bacterium]|nr:hypothetical protein [Acidobacteriota bacterium]